MPISCIHQNSSLPRSEYVHLDVIQPPSYRGTVKTQNSKVIVVIAQIYLLYCRVCSRGMHARVSWQWLPKCAERYAENRRKCVSVCAFPGQISILEKLNNKTKTKCGFSTIKLFNASNDIHFWRELGLDTYIRVFNICALFADIDHTIYHHRSQTPLLPSRCFVTG